MTNTHKSSYQRGSVYKIHAGICAGAIILLGTAFGASAQDLTYTPTSPTFGGNPFNSSHLLGVANAQNDYKDPAAASSDSMNDLFARQLQSRLLSAFSSQLTDAIFGENAQEHGTFSLGDETVNFDRDLENVNITITNNATGEITNVTVPLFVEIN